MEVTPNFIASLVKGRVEGDGDIKISNFAKIEEAGPGDITFIANPKYSHFINTTQASAVIVNNDFVTEGPVNPVLIYVEDAYSSLAELLAMVDAMKPSPVGIEQPCYVAEDVEVPEDVYIGAFAYIGKGVKIGKNAKIYPQSYIGDNVVIGDNTVIRAGVKIYEGCRLGADCIIHSGVVIGADGFGFAPKGEIYEKIPQTGIVVIEDNVEIGANTTVDRATFGCTRIGAGTKLDNLIQIAHNVEVGENNVFASQVGVAGSTKIGNHNMVGGQVGFAGHINIGNYNQIGAQSGIPNDVGDGKRLMGYPAVEARQFAKNAVYIRRLGEMFDEIKKLKQQQ